MKAIFLDLGVLVKMEENQTVKDLLLENRVFLSRIVAIFIFIFILKKKNYLFVCLKICGRAVPPGNLLK